MKGIGIRFESDGDDEEDREYLEAVVAISPEEEVYFQYEEMPLIPVPSFLMVKGGAIVADRWIIAIKPGQPFFDFATRLCMHWNDNTDESRRQLSAFLEALEQEMRRNK